MAQLGAGLVNGPLTPRRAASAAGLAVPGRGCRLGPNDGAEAVVIPGLTLLLAFQLLGEAVARGLGLSMPGPVLGMAVLALLLATAPRLLEMVRGPAQALLSHLSLLFVPAGVGIVGHLDALGADAVGLVVAIVVSTVLAIATGALVFRAVARLTGADDG
jgi:holin-like protein